MMLILKLIIKNSEYNSLNINEKINYKVEELKFLKLVKSSLIGAIALKLLMLKSKN